VEQVLIPYEMTALPGYFYRPNDSEKPRPTLLVHGGYDSIGEELYLLVAAAAIQRKYNCLIFEGPGQGALIREQHLPFRPDWERVVTPVVDYLLTAHILTCWMRSTGAAGKLGLLQSVGR